MSLNFASITASVHSPPWPRVWPPRRLLEATGTLSLAIALWLFRELIYGPLPLENRTAQAGRFNNPDSGYDVLVASDAIGMGLNLSIKRIIFNSMFKFDGAAPHRLRQ